MNRALYRSTVIALVFSIVMTVLSAHIRLSDSGIRLRSPWPACFADSFQIDDQPGVSIHRDDPGKTMRMLHRLIASLFGLLVLFQFTLACWYRRTLDHGLLCPALILTLTILLAMVGMNTPDLSHPIVTFINLSGGMALTACLYWYLLAFSPPAPSSTILSSTIASSTVPSPLMQGRPVILITLIAVFLSIASGAWVSGNFAAGACEEPCAWQGSFAEAFTPDRTLVLTDKGVLMDGQQPLILLVHQVIAAVTFLLLITSAVLNWRKIRLLQGIMLAGAVFALAGIVVAEHFIHTVWLASAHNGLSLLLLLVLIHQYRRWDTQ